MVKGIILAGGAGSRLYPATSVISKQLLPVYDKPMIYYPLSVLMLAGIKDILIISTPEDISRFEDLLQDGSQWGLRFSYAVQPRPEGLAQSFIIGKKFIGQETCALILGDNIFFGNELMNLLQKGASKKQGATIFAYKVSDSKRYGIIEFTPQGKPFRIVEKPLKSPSKYAVTGLYFFDNRVIGIAENLKPSARGELEISDINQAYLEMGDLEVQFMRRGMAWLDTGTFDSLMDASLFIQTLQKRQGVKLACVEEIALKMGYIDIEKFIALGEKAKNSGYGDYILEVAAEIQQTQLIDQESLGGRFI